MTRKELFEEIVARVQNPQNKEKLEKQRNIPYAIDSNHVFFPFKIRSTDIMENNRAFINVKFIREIKGTSIVLDTGEEIQTLTTNKALIQNKILARALLMEEILQTTLQREKTLKYMTAYLKG